MDALMSLMPALLILTVIALVVRGWRQRNRRLKQNFDWYVAQHPECYVNNKISCVKCGGTHVRARSMMNRQYTVAHSCSQCGSVLYYSPES